MAEANEQDRVTKIVTPVQVDYTYTPGRSVQTFLHAIKNGTILGMRCGSCSKVYVPSRGSCPRCGVAITDSVEVVDKGTVTTFCIVRVPSPNIQVELPYCVAHILLDGADIPFFYLIQECEFDQVRMGMRVQAVWKDEAEWDTTFENIKYFKPIDEPDVAYDDFKEHL